MARVRQRVENMVPNLSGGRREDERLMKLFWKRAALKKEFRKLRDQVYELESRLGQQDLATQRAQDRFDSLEVLFANPEAGFNGIVYFQLRNLWRTCRSELEKFARELRRQQEQKERRKEIMQFNLKRGERIKKLHRLIGKMTGRLDEVSARMLEIAGELDAAKAFWSFFKRRRLSQELEELKAEKKHLRSQLEVNVERKNDLEEETWPEFEGTSVEGRRAINIAVIALGQLLYEHFSRLELADLAKEAMVKPIEEIKYGSREECERAMQAIPNAISSMKGGAQFTKLLKAYSACFGEAARYAKDGDTVPTAESLDSVELPSDAMLKQGKINLLRAEFWDVYAALLQ